MKKPLLFVAIGALAAAALSACAHGPSKTSAPSTSEKPRLTLNHGDSTVGTFVSVPRGFFTNSYWIEGPTGLILIDTQFLLSEAATFVDWAERTTGKKAVLAIVLHPNPDKFNGVHVLRKRGIRVITSDQVKALIPAVHQDRYDAFYERFKPDYPQTAPELESFGSKTTEIEAGGAKVKLHVLGAGCSGAHVVVEYHQQVFVGDLIGPGNHAWLELGLIDDWLKRIAEIRALNPRWIYPGRGPSGGDWILDDEEAYLRKVKQLVAAEKPRKDISDEERDRRLERVQKKMVALYPQYDYLHFLEIGLPAVWEKMLKINVPH